MLFRRIYFLGALFTIALANVPVNAGFAGKKPSELHPHWEALYTINLEVAGTLNQMLEVNRRIHLTSNTCGHPQAYYRPINREFSRIVFCYELLIDIIDEFKLDGYTPEQLNAGIAGVVRFVLLHEIGHALIDIFDLPILGMEEDAADQFAALVLSDNGGDLLWSAKYFRENNDFGDLGLKNLIPLTLEHFADEHSLSMQRFYNILCIAYGSDPQGNSFLQRHIGRRSERCTYEFERAMSSWKKLLTPYKR